MLTVPHARSVPRECRGTTRPSIAAAEARSAIDTIEAKASDGKTPAHGLRLEHLRRPPEGT